VLRQASTSYYTPYGAAPTSDNMQIYFLAVFQVKAVLTSARSLEHVPEMSLKRVGRFVPVCVILLTLYYCCCILYGKCITSERAVYIVARFRPLPPPVIVIPIAGIAGIYIAVIVLTDVKPNKQSLTSWQNDGPLSVIGKCM
jgi:hypothetical protein